MASPFARRSPGSDPQERRIRRTWRFLSSSIFVLGLVTVLRLLAGNPGRIDWLLAGLVVVAGVAVALHRGAVSAIEAGRRSEAESFARILQGLSRSVSPDAIVDAIVEELGVGTDADHTVVVRLRPDARVLEATLVSQRPGVPSSTTILPISDLDDRLVATERVARTPIPVHVAPDELGAVGAGAIERRAGEGARRRGGGDRRRTWSVLGVVASVRASTAQEPTVAEERSRRRTADPARRTADRLAARVREVYGLQHTLAAPLMSGSDVVGAIVLSRRTSEPWTPSAERILAGAAVEASAALERAYSHRAAEARASTDALTGLPNRRYFDEFCGLLARRHRADDALGVLMIDIDHFKRLNDTYGHATGDHVLRAVAGAIASAVREDDVPARFGGEEFAVLLRNPSRSVAVEVGERVRASVRALDLGPLGVSGVSVSVGVAVSSSPDQPIDALVEEADRALYRAKRAGRDRVAAA